MEEAVVRWLLVVLTLSGCAGGDLTRCLSADTNDEYGCAVMRL